MARTRINGARGYKWRPRTQAEVEEKIRELKGAGYTERQAIATALKMRRKGRR